MAPGPVSGRAPSILFAAALLAVRLVTIGCTGGSTGPIAADAAAPDEAVALTFDEFYSGYSVRQGLTLSERLRSLEGSRVRMRGYMAPPLKPALDFFVLTRIRLAVCPFCSTAGDWPSDIALVYVVGDPITTSGRPLSVEGRLELGAKTDAETGMVSVVRIYADRIDLL